MENALQQDNEEAFSQSIGHFYRLKYGTTTPSLSRLDSAIKRAKSSCSHEVQTRVHRVASSIPQMSHKLDDRFAGLGVGTCRTYTVGTGTSINESLLEQNSLDDVYVDMEGEEPLKEEPQVGEGGDDDDEEGYTFMFRGKGLQENGEVESSETDEKGEKEDTREDEKTESKTPQETSALYTECDISPRYVVDSTHNKGSEEGEIHTRTCIIYIIHVQRQ